MLINNIIALYIACHQLTLVSYKEFSVSLRIGHGNVQKMHVLFEKLTAAVVLNLRGATLTHEGPGIEILHTKIIFHKIPSILGIHTNLIFFVRPTS